jgi:hypothetical protein
VRTVSLPATPRRLAPSGAAWPPPVTPRLPSKSAEEALAQDARHFDDHLKESDASLQAALRGAEAEARRRQARAQQRARLCSMALGMGAVPAAAAGMRGLAHVHTTRLLDARRRR